MTHKDAERRFTRDEPKELSLSHRDKRYRALGCVCIVIVLYLLSIITILSVLEKTYGIVTTVVNRFQLFFQLAN